MRRRPWILVVLAVLHFIFPFGNTIWNAIDQNKNIWNHLIFSMTPEQIAGNWVNVLAPIVAGFAIYSCKRWSFYLYLLSVSSFFYFNWASASTNPGGASFLALVAGFLIYVAIVSYFLIPAVREIYFDRRVRWWEPCPRYSTNFQCHWRELNTTSMETGTATNFSVSGLFLKTDIKPIANGRVHVQIPFNNMSCDFEGEAVIHDDSDSSGFGVKFVHSKKSRRSAKNLVEYLAKEGMRITTNDLRPEDSFTYWVRTLITTGKGWMPSRDNKSS